MTKEELERALQFEKGFRGKVIDYLLKSDFISDASQKRIDAKIEELQNLKASCDAQIANLQKPEEVISEPGTGI